METPRATDAVALPLLVIGLPILAFAACHLLAPLGVRSSRTKKARTKKAVVIGISGRAGVGKDTIADMLVRRKGFTKLCIADVLRWVTLAVAREVLGFTDVTVEWLTDRRVKELPFAVIQQHVRAHPGFFEDADAPAPVPRDDDLEEDASTAAGVAVPAPASWVTRVRALTPRRLMQILGTDVARQYMAPDIWLQATLRRIHELQADTPHEQQWVVLSDVRFRNEKEALCAPAEHALAYTSTVLRLDNPEQAQLDARRSEPLHVSETQLDAELFGERDELRIENDPNIPDLERLWRRVDAALVAHCGEHYGAYDDDSGDDNDGRGAAAHHHDPMSE